MTNMATDSREAEAVRGTVLVVEARGERFAVPQDVVTELVSVLTDGAQEVERINGAPVLRLRERLLPLVCLGTLLAADPASAGSAGGVVVAMQVGGCGFGVIVDRVLHAEDVIVGAAASVWREVEVLSGSAILADGSVVLVLSPAGLCRVTGVQDAPQDVEIQAEATAQIEPTAELLVFFAAGGQQKAVPLSLVARIEEVEQTRMEAAGNGRVLQYRGQLMPLVEMATATSANAGMQAIIVFSHQDRFVGLAVERIADIVQQRLSIELEGCLPGSLGTAVIGGVATDIIDVGYVMSEAYQLLRLVMPPEAQEAGADTVAPAQLAA